MVKKIKKKFQKKIINIAGSFGVVIPAHIIHELNMEKGEVIEVVVSKLNKK